ncbi:hypothetical protein C5167_008475, partial [Papaver somniferum]
HQFSFFFFFFFFQFPIFYFLFPLFPQFSLFRRNQFPQRNPGRESGTISWCGVFLIVTSSQRDEGTQACKITKVAREPSKIRSSESTKYEHFLDGSRL